MRSAHYNLRSISRRRAQVARRFAVGHVRRERLAFSLAEMMIALAILGLGLLFIAASLPAGIDYNRKTIDLINGDAASESAWAEIEQSVRTSSRPIPTSAPRNVSSVFRPRNVVVAAGGQEFRVNNTFEPVFKVRPLVMRNISLDALSGGGGAADVVDYGEAAITAAIGPAAGPTQTDFATTFAASLANHPAIGAFARLYPSPGLARPVGVGDVRDFLSAVGGNNEYPWYAPSTPPALTPDSGQAGSFVQDLRKAAATRIGWAALYRRVSYATTGTAPNLEAVDPLLYEFVLVVMRRVSDTERYASQDLNAGSFTDPVALGPTGDRAAPRPWLVAFQDFENELDAGTDYDGAVLERPLLAAFTDRPNLRFRCSQRAGALLPVGSIVVPALNDVNPAAQAFGFAPNSAEALPIYRVLERPDATTVVLENNGLYPWKAPGVNWQDWYVWVFPPAFSQRDGSGQPIFEQRSSILTVQRRMLRLPEIP